MDDSECDSEQGEASEGPPLTMGELFQVMAEQYEHMADNNRTVAANIDRTIAGFGPVALGPENQEIWDSILQRFNTAKQTVLATTSPLTSLAAALGDVFNFEDECGV